MLGSESETLTSPLMGEICVSSNDDESNGAEHEQDAASESSIPTEHDDNRINSSSHNPTTSFCGNPVQLSAMISNFSTSYNVVNISLVLPILDSIHKVSEEQEATCASSLLLGMVVGQLVGGALGDSFLGRLGALRVVMAFQIVASLGSALLPPSKHLLFWLAIWRFFLGIGAGGVYPLAAVLSAEQGSDAHHAVKIEDETPQERMLQLRRVVLTFSMQGVGFLAVPLLTVPLLLTFPNNLNLVWRLVLGVGSIPGLLLVILQWHVQRAHQRHDTLPQEEPTDNEGLEAGTDSHENGNTPHSSETGHDFSLVPENERHDDTASAANTVSTSTSILSSIWHEPHLIQKLLGTAGTWFLFDVLFYGNTLFEPIVMEAAFSGNGGGDVLLKAATDSLILACIALPGYIYSAMVMGKRVCYIPQTPRFVQMQGFVAMALLYAIIGAYWNHLKRIPALLVLLYGCTFAFANYGPNTTTFVLPSLVYSPECRSTLNGISAAAGKAGALLGATMFEPASDALGDDKVMLICASVSVLAFAMTRFFVQLPPVTPSQV